MSSVLLFFKIRLGLLWLASWSTIEMSDAAPTEEPDGAGPGLEEAAVDDVMVATALLHATAFAATVRPMRTLTSYAFLDFATTKRAMLMVVI